jgi:hypothetical protein
MRFRLFLFAIFIAVLFSGIVFSGNDHLIVYGENFAFKVNEMGNWKGYTKDAWEYGLNIYFTLDNEDFNSAPVVMYIRVMEKGNYSATEHLLGDMEDFKDKFSDIKFKDFTITGLPYQATSKIYLYNDICDYVCYLDPSTDTQLPLYLIFVLSGTKELAPKFEDDFATLVNSFQWINLEAQ